MDSGVAFGGLSKSPPTQRMLDTRPAPACRCSTCDGVLIRSLDSSTYDLPTDGDGRCPRCMFADTRCCPGCGVHRDAHERAAGPCEVCDDAAQERAYLVSAGKVGAM